MKNIYAIKVLKSLVNNIDNEIGQQYIFIHTSGKVDENMKFLFSTINKIFIIYKDAIDIFWLELECLKKYGK